MVKNICIYKYKKLSDINIEFNAGVNAISGTNGTCKTSLLHIVSNSFQAVSRTSPMLETTLGLDAVNKLNAQVNTKIEKLARGDKKYNDPALNHPGTLFEVTYYENGSTLSFRRHNYKIANRYSIKPQYPKGKHESLPAMPVVYLSLTRLFPFGEYQDDNSIKKSAAKLTEPLVEELASLYKNITGIQARAFTSQKMGAVKNRQEFDTDSLGIDSNTISSGEDNVLILLTALISLRYYYEQLKPEAKSSEVASILLIDEFDATLHPSFQYKLVDVARQYAVDYHIQVIFTTHSLTLLEYMFHKKMNVIYLMDFIDNVQKMESPDPQKIEMYLKEQMRDELYVDKTIPVFSEDEEARFFANLIIDVLVHKADAFLKVQRDIHFVEANFGAEELIKLFKDQKVKQSSVASICLLDGDHQSKLGNNTLSLPGGKSPEWVAFNHLISLTKDTGNQFWTSKSVIEAGIGIATIAREIVPKIEDFKNSPHSERKQVKDFFNRHIVLFEFILKDWIHDDRNKSTIEKFASELSMLYKKTANYHGIYVASDENFSITDD